MSEEIKTNRDSYLSFVQLCLRICFHSQDSTSSLDTLVMCVCVCVVHWANIVDSRALISLFICPKHFNTLTHIQ